MVKQKFSSIFQTLLITLLIYLLLPDIIHASSDVNNANSSRPHSVDNVNNNDYCIEGRVWLEDANDLDVNERNGIENIRIHLYSHTGEEIDDTLTDADGNFRFENLRPGPYNIQLIRKFGYHFTGPDSEISPDPAKEFQSIDSSPCSNTIPLGASLVEAPGESEVIDGTSVDTIELKIEYKPSYPPAMKISWVTSMEVDLEGFHIHRSDTGARLDATRVSRQRIDGLGQGRREEIRYVYFDYDIRVSTDIIYSYWLTEEEYSNGETLFIDHGPVHEEIFAADYPYTQVYLPLIMK